MEYILVFPRLHSYQSNSFVARLSRSSFVRGRGPHVRTSTGLDELATADMHIGPLCAASKWC